MEKPWTKVSQSPRSRHEKRMRDFLVRALTKKRFDMEENMGRSGKANRLRLDAEEIMQRTIADVLPDRAVCEALKKLELTGRVFVLAVGKAAWVMAQTAERCLGGRMEKGLVVTKYGHAKEEPGRFAVIEAGHPVPDENSLRAGREAVRFLQEAGAQDTVLFLLSGGGSALLELPQEGLSLSDMQEATEQLLRCGAGMTEINLIRKRLSAVKGGKLAGCLKTGRAYSIILSDVVGGSDDMIASGLTYPDHSDPNAARHIVEKYGLKLPSHVEKILMRDGREGKPTAENHVPVENRVPEEKHVPMENRVPVENHVVGSVRELCLAAAGHAEALGYHPYLLTASMQGEAKEAGRWISSLADNPEYERPFALIAGGETVVRVTGNGKGGRNQELALSAARFLEGKEDVLLFSLGSDGTDGPTDAAGGIVDGETAGRLRSLGMDIGEVLQENDAYHALQAIGGLLITGATGTNVNDVTVLLHA